MCDTIVKVEAGRVFFAKNSDRDANEAQVVEWHPRASHPAGEMLRCTHIAIPQAAQTHAIVISRPFWMWGAEMGANEHGVAIGNEAVFTNQPYAKTGLTGMDLLRLALERASTAARAVEVITDLISTHGQGGGCGLEHPAFTYHNSFLVADPREAFVLETAGKHWAVEQVTGVRSISNGLTIPEFRARYASKPHELVSACRTRRGRTEQLAAQQGGVAGMMATLQDYGGADVPRYSIVNGGLGVPCVHAGGLLVNTQTTGSMVSELRPEGQVHWITGTSIPSLSLFKPVRVGEPVEMGAMPTDKADENSLWWKHERLCRRVFKNPVKWLPEIRAELAGIQRQWLQHPPESAEAFAMHHELLDKWLAQVPDEDDTRPWYTRRFWRKRDAMVGMG